MVVIGGIIGSGIFINSVHRRAAARHAAARARRPGSSGGAIALAGAFCYAELGALFPKAGGQYVYLRDGLHPLAGFPLRLGAAAHHRDRRDRGGRDHLCDLRAASRRRSGRRARAARDRALVVLSVVNYLGVKPGSRVLNVLVVLKVAALAILIGAGLFAAAHGRLVERRPADGRRMPRPRSSPSARRSCRSSSRTAAGRTPTTSREEIDNPTRNLPLSLIAGTIAVVVIYVTVNVVYLRALGLEGLAATTTPAADVAGRVFGALGDRFVSAAIAISTFGFLDLAILAPTRVYYAMAADRVFVPALAHAASALCERRAWRSSCSRRGRASSR